MKIKKVIPKHGQSPGIYRDYFVRGNISTIEISFWYFPDDCDVDICYVDLGQHQALMRTL